MSTPDNTKEIAVLAGGCFWCVEAVLEQLRGVEHVESGYAGGHVPNPTYQQICTGTTGHAEVVRVRFDSREISYQEILKVFFMTTLVLAKMKRFNPIGQGRSKLNKKINF